MTDLLMIISALIALTGIMLIRRDTALYFAEVNREPYLYAVTGSIAGSTMALLILVLIKVLL